MCSYWKTLGALLVAIAGLGVWSAHRVLGSAPTPVPRTSDERPPVDGRDVAVPVDAVPRAARHPPPSKSNDDAATPAMPVPFEHDEGRAVLLESRFVQDRGTSPWAVSVRTPVAAMLQDALPAGGSLISFECRATLCRAELALPQLMDVNAVVDGLWDGGRLFDLGFGGIKRMSFDEDETDARVVLLLIKSGVELYPMPTIDEE